MINFRKHSGIYTLQVMQQLPIGLPEAWAFFSAPENLLKITPQHMGFKITSGQTGEMYPGQIISYRLSPLPGVKSNWVTEITHVEHQKYFVDEQRFGPYSMWHHEHRFEENEFGVEMTDIVRYKIPLGFLGHLAHRIFVKRQLRKIFEYRIHTLDKKFH